MTTSPVVSITDEQLEEIAFDARVCYRACVTVDDLDPGELLALIADARRYRALCKVTPYRFRKMQEASITDGGDVFYFHRDRFDEDLDALIEKAAQ